MMKFYVIVRTDMESMTSGRVAAQVSHATSELHERGKESRRHDGDNESFLEWKGAGNFGTTIVLGYFGDPNDLTCDHIAEMDGFVFDPEYSIRDGNVTHKLPITTCYWTLVDTDRCPNPFPDLDLYGRYN